MIEMYRTFDFHVTDRWGRTPIFGLLNENEFPYWHILKRLLAEFDPDINYQDKYGTTLLHLIGYMKDENTDLEDTKQVLLDKAKLNTLEIKDKENNKPFQTALCHGNFKTFKMIAAKMPTVTVETEGCYASEVFTHYSLKSVCLSELIVSSDINFSIEGFPRDIEQFTKDLLRMKHVNFHPETKSEESDIYESVGTLIQKICDKVKMYDSKFCMHIFRTGSTAEGTKVGRPDEFDFALCLDLVEKNCNIETVTDEDNTVYAMLKFKDESSSSDFLPFYDEDRYLQVRPLLICLYRYIHRALFEADIWAEGNIIFNDDFKILWEKPVFNFSVSWVGSKYKQLNISVDLVPAVYKRGWWPPGFDLSLKNIVNEHVRDAGCFVLLQSKTKTNDFMKRWVTGIQDCVFDTCNVYVGVEDLQTKTKRRCLTLSVAPAEIALIKSFPEQFRKAYALAKIVKDKMVCPNIVIDVYPDEYELKCNSKDVKCNSKEVYRGTHPNKEVKSYWLKNCTFYVAEYLQSAYRDLEHTNISTVEMTVMIYEKLLELVSESRISPYLYQSTDVLMLEKKGEWETKYLKQMLLLRKISIDGVLKFLGKSIRCDNTEWLEYCMKHYTHRVFSEDKSIHSAIELYKRP